MLRIILRYCSLTVRKQDKKVGRRADYFNTNKESKAGNMKAYKDESPFMGWKAYVDESGNKYELEAKGCGIYTLWEYSDSHSAYLIFFTCIVPKTKRSLKDKHEYIMEQEYLSCLCGSKDV